MRSGQEDEDADLEPGHSVLPPGGERECPPCPRRPLRRQRQGALRLRGYPQGLPVVWPSNHLQHRDLPAERSGEEARDPRRDDAAVDRRRCLQGCTRPGDDDPQGGARSTQMVSDSGAAARARRPGCRDATLMAALHYCPRWNSRRCASARSRRRAASCSSASRWAYSLKSTIGSAASEINVSHGTILLCARVLRTTESQRRRCSSGSSAWTRRAWFTMSPISSSSRW